jgi:hypothetical protein
MVRRVVTDTLKLTPTESVTIRSATPEALEVEAEYGPNGSPPPKHLHPAQDERFRVLEGALRLRVDGSSASSAPARRSRSRAGRCIRCGTRARPRRG